MTENCFSYLENSKAHSTPHLSCFAIHLPLQAKGKARLVRIQRKKRIFRSFLSVCFFAGSLHGLAVISANFVGTGVPCQEQDCKHLCKRIVYTFYVQSCRFCRVRRPRRTVLFLQRKRIFFLSLLAFVFLLIYHKWSPFSAREGKGVVRV